MKDDTGDDNLSCPGTPGTPRSSRDKNKPKRYRRKSNELDKVFPCPIRFCLKKYGSMSALRLHMAMKHSLKRPVSVSARPNLNDGCLSSASYDCGLGNILPEVPSGAQTAFNGSPQVNPMHLPPAHDSIEKPSPLIDRFFQRNGYETSSGSEHSPLNRKAALQHNMPPQHMSSSPYPTPPSQQHTPQHHPISPPSHGPLGSSSCPDFLLGNGFSEFMHHQGMNNNPGTPKGPFAMQDLTNSLSTSRRNSGNYMSSYDGMDMGDPAVEETFDLESILAVFHNEPNPGMNRNYSQPMAPVMHSSLRTSSCPPGAFITHTEGVAPHLVNRMQQPVQRMQSDSFNMGSPVQVHGSWDTFGNVVSQSSSLAGLEMQDVSLAASLLTPQQQTALEALLTDSFGSYGHDQMEAPMSWDRRSDVGKMDPGMYDEYVV